MGKWILLFKSGILCGLFCKRSLRDENVKKMGATVKYIISFWEDYNRHLGTDIYKLKIKEKQQESKITKENEKNTVKSKSEKNISSGDE